MADLRKKARFEQGQGFVAALDQSGGSTPKALAMYGIDESAYSSEQEMFDLIHEERVRIVTNQAFTASRIVGAILFEDTLDREIQGMPSADYLWNVKGIVPFLKIDKGLEDEAHGVQLMKDIPGLDELLTRAAAAGVYGTKERSVIKQADDEGIRAIVAQQCAVARRVLDARLVPILEPEVDINCPAKAEAERILKAELFAGLEALPEDAQVAVKITIPAVPGFYTDLMQHPKVARVVALSGGYSRDEADQLLAQNPNLIASFSRALLDGLTAQQSEAEFTATLEESIESIYQASVHRV